MGELRFAGLATGIDTAALIKQLMIVNSRRLASYQIKKTSYESQNTALDELRSKISNLKSAVGALSDTDNMSILSANSSDKDMLTISASSDAEPGSHSIEINQLATTETWIQDTSAFDYKTDFVGGGNFIYSYHNQERVIAATENETTLEDLVNLINNDEDNPGVTASLLYQGDKYHLMLSGQETGEDYQISINSSNTQVWQASSALTSDEDNAGLNTKITELDSFSGTLGSTDNAYITIGGTRTDGTALTATIAVTENTTVGHVIDEINSRFEVDGQSAATATLVDGKIHLTDNTSGASTLALNTITFNPGTGSATLTDITVAESVQGGSTSESLASLASATFTQTQNAQNSQIKVDDYTPTAVAEKQTLTTNAAATGGTFTLSYGGETTGTIASNATLAEIETALELLPTVGDITVEGDTLDSGPANMTFTFANTLGNTGLISINTSLTGTDGTETITETTKGNDSQWVSRNSNSIADALTGITLNLNDLTEAGDSVAITITRNTGAVSAKLQTMISSYNELVTELKTKTQYDPEAKKMGVLSKDVAASFISTQMKNSFIGIADGFVGTIDSFVQASDLGLTINGQGLLELDTDEFNSAINDDFDSVLELLGATKNGNSDSNIIQFYGASDKYTTAGTYDVEVDIIDNAIASVRIKLSSESTWREDATWADNLITGNSDFDEGDPINPENGLQFSIDPTQANGTYTATINVKQGIVGNLEDSLDELLKNDGRLDISEGVIDDRISAMTERIEREEKRLTNVETRLIAKYARLERILSMMQQQMGAAGMLG